MSFGGSFLLSAFDWRSRPTKGSLIPIPNPKLSTPNPKSQMLGTIRYPKSQMLGTIRLPQIANARYPKSQMLGTIPKPQIGNGRYHSFYVAAQLGIWKDRTTSKLQVPLVATVDLPSAPRPLSHLSLSLSLSSSLSLLSRSLARSLSRSLSIAFSLSISLSLSVSLLLSLSLSPSLCRSALADLVSPGFF